MSYFHCPLCAACLRLGSYDHRWHAEQMHSMASEDLEELVPFKQSPLTAKALKQIAKGKTPYRAAKDCGIALSTIYRALKRQRDQK